MTFSSARPTIGLIAALLVLSCPLAGRSDTLNVTFKAFALQGKASEEPIWIPTGKDRKWVVKSVRFDEKYQAPEFPEVEETVEFGEEFRLVSTKTLRGRIVIDLYSGDMHLAHSQDNLLGDACALSYTHTTGGGVLKFEIKTWTHP